MCVFQYCKEVDPLRSNKLALHIVHLDQVYLDLCVCLGGLLSNAVSEWMCVTMLLCLVTF